jgi:secreted trypsin-like serine protease
MINPSFFLLRALVITGVILSLGCSSGGGDQDSSGTDDSKACGLLGLPVKSLVTNSPAYKQLHPKVIDGVTCGSLGGSPIVRVVIATPQASTVTALCTGTMISSTKVLTAEHCVEKVGSDGNFAAIVFGDINALSSVRASRIIRSPRYVTSNGRALNDIAILELASPVSLPTLPLIVSGQAIVGEEGAVYGYGVTEDGPEADDIGSDLVSGYMTVDAVTNELIYVVYNGDGVNTCSGDSGGPLVLSRGGRVGIAGVVSQGSSAGCEAGDTTSYTSVLSSEVASWLSKNAGDAGRI